MSSRKRFWHKNKSQTGGDSSGKGGGERKETGVGRRDEITDEMKNKVGKDDDFLSMNLDEIAEVA